VEAGASNCAVVREASSSESPIVTGREGASVANGLAGWEGGNSGNGCTAQAATRDMASNKAAIFIGSAGGIAARLSTPRSGFLPVGRTCP